jgi:hypothetical protein
MAVIRGKLGLSGNEGIHVREEGRGNGYTLVRDIDAVGGQSQRGQCAETSAYVTLSDDQWGRFLTVIGERQRVGAIL